MELQELSWRERGRLWMRLGIRLVLTVLTLLVLFRFGPPVFSLFMPFFLAFIAAWLLNPLVRVIQKHLGIPRKLLSLLLILLILAGAVGIVTAFVWNIASETLALANNWPSILDAFQQSFDAISQLFSRLMVMLPSEVRESANTLLSNLSDQMISWLGRYLPDLVTSAAQGATGIARRIPSFAVATVVFLMSSFYLTADYPHIRYFFTHRLNDRVRRLLREIRTAAISAFGGYLKAEFILSVGVFFILLIGFTAISQSYALLFAFFLAILDFIPIIGAGTIMVPWAVVDLFMGDFRSTVELMVIWGIIVLFRRIMEPKFVGDQTGLPPVVSLISIYVGMRVGGVLGMILAPVLCMVAINISRLGLFTPFLTDLRLAVNDVSAFLRNAPSAPEDNSKKI